MLIFCIVFAMKDSNWIMIGALSSVLGFLMLVGSIIALLYGFKEYGILIVFGAIFLIIGIGLVAITSFEKKTQ